MENKDLLIEMDAPFAPAEKLEQKARTNYRYSVWNDIKREFRANKIACVCVVLLAIIMIASLLAPLSPYDPDKISISEKFQGISAKHWFGTDDYGRDYFTRALYGGRVSLMVGFGAMAVTTILGTALGVFSGYVGGKVDALIMRLTDIFLALPSMLLMVVLNAFLKPSLPTLILVLSLFAWPSIARITRAETMSLKERDFMVASKNLGAGNLRLALHHIIPNILGPVVVSSSMNVANAILMESSLSFMGLGVRIPQASWGSMLETAQSQILSMPRLTILPGVLILITVLSFNLIGDVLRSALEPKIKK